MDLQAALRASLNLNASSQGPGLASVAKAPQKPPDMKSDPPLSINATPKDVRPKPSIAQKPSANGGTNWDALLRSVSGNNKPKPLKSSSGVSIIRAKAPQQISRPALKDDTPPGFTAVEENESFETIETLQGLTATDLFKWQMRNDEVSIPSAEYASTDAKVSMKLGEEDFPVLPDYTPSTMKKPHSIKSAKSSVKPSVRELKTGAKTVPSNKSKLVTDIISRAFEK
jgi:hypothetical protein